MQFPIWFWRSRLYSNLWVLVKKYGLSIASHADWLSNNSFRIFSRIFLQEYFWLWTWLVCLDESNAIILMAWSTCALSSTSPSCVKVQCRLPSCDFSSSITSTQLGRIVPFIVWTVPSISPPFFHRINASFISLNFCAINSWSLTSGHLPWHWIFNSWHRHIQV